MTVHPFVSDGIEYPDNVRRCARCDLPEHNRSHDTAAVDEQNNEHRRRSGDGEA